MIVLRFRHGGCPFNPIKYAEEAGEDKLMDVIGLKLIIKVALMVDYRSTFGINNTIIVPEGVRNA